MSGLAETRLIPFHKGMSAHIDAMAELIEPLRKMETTSGDIFAAEMIVAILGVPKLAPVAEEIQKVADNTLPSENLSNGLIKEMKTVE